MNQSIRIGILTASDRASAGTYEDLSGPAIVDCLQDYLDGAFETVRRLVPDDFDAIEKGLLELCHHEHCCLVLTTGGTGPAPRDVTPEVTTAVCEKLIPGFGERMRAVSIAKVPTAILSRQTAGVRGKTLIINLPGKPQAIRECLDAVFGAIPDCIDQIGGPKLQCKSHLKSYRHKEA
ncbi:MAG: molybdopterin adenylyltransferase [Planctomycetota bacterium]